MATAPANGVRTRVTEIDREIGERIRAARQRRSLSLADLATPVGVTWQQVQKYETGINRVSGAHLISLAGALGTTPHALLGWGASPEKDEIDRASADPCMVELVRALAALPAAARRNLADAFTIMARPKAGAATP